MFLFYFVIFSFPLKLDCLDLLVYSLQVWVATENGNLEVTYTHNEEHVCCINISCMSHFDLMPISSKNKRVLRDRSSCFVFEFSKLPSWGKVFGRPAGM